MLASSTSGLGALKCSDGLNKIAQGTAERLPPCSAAFEVAQFLFLLPQVQRALPLILGEKVRMRGLHSALRNHGPSPCPSLQQDAKPRLVEEREPKKSQLQKPPPWAFLSRPFRPNANCSYSFMAFR